MPGSGWDHSQELLGWVIVQPLLGTGQILGKRIPGILFGTVTDDGPGPESGRKELKHIWEWKHLEKVGLEGFAVLNVWKNINTIMRQRKNGEQSERSRKRWCWLWENTEGLQRDRAVELKIECDITHSGTQVELL